MEKINNRPYGVTETEYTINHRFDLFEQLAETLKSNTANLLPLEALEVLMWFRPIVYNTNMFKPFHLSEDAYRKLSVLQTVANGLSYESMHPKLITKDSLPCKDTDYIKAVIEEKLSHVPHYEHDNIDYYRMYEIPHNSLIQGMFLKDLVVNNLPPQPLTENNYDFTPYLTVPNLSLFNDLKRLNWRNLGYNINYSFKPYKADYMYQLRDFILNANDGDLSPYMLEVKKELNRKLIYVPKERRNYLKLFHIGI